MAGGELSRREGLLLSVSFLVSSAVLSVFVGPIFPFLMLTYFLLWLAYSHPKIHLKSRPVIDLIVAGIGAGLMPFLAGWNAFLSSSSFPITLALTFLLAQAGGHTLHTVGDREADILVGMNTSAVRFGERVVSRCGLAFFLFSLVLFIASVSKREIPLLVAAIPIVILPVASHTISRYIVVIRKGADTPSSFEEIRKATVRVQICFLAAYALAFLFIAAVHPSLGH
jgi:4-hydroxybenzoate polyprenyltransferase